MQGKKPVNTAEYNQTGSAAKRIFLCGALALAFGASGCSSPAVKPPATSPQAPLIWPSPPEPARVSYLKAIRKPEDIGVSKGFFRKIADYVLGSRTDDMVKPYGVAVDSMGRLVVADTSFKRVHVYDQQKKEYLSIEEAGKEAFISPIAASTDADNNIYVTDSLAAKVFVFSPKGRFLHGFKAGKRPTGIAINKQDKKIFISDTASHSINIYDLKGTPLGSIGKWGGNTGEFNYPVDLAIDRNGELFVVDSMNYRIQIFSREGRFISSFGRHGDGTGDFGRPKGVAVDRDGNIYVADALFDTVQIFDRKGNFLLNFGALGRAAGNFWLPCGVYIDEANRIYISDSYNGRVQVFEYHGQG